MQNSEHYHTFSVLVENEFGVLARVAGMFAGRGFNIDALSVAPTPDRRYSRITLTTHGNDQIIEQILKQLNRLVDVLKVVDLSSEDTLRRELCLVKVRITAEQENVLQSWIKEHGVQVLFEEKKRLWVLEFVDEQDKIEKMLRQLQDFEILETVRTGNIALHKGKKILNPA